MHHFYVHQALFNIFAHGTNTQWDILSIGLEIQFTVLRFDKMVQGNDFFFLV